MYPLMSAVLSIKYLQLLHINLTNDIRLLLVNQRVHVTCIYLLNFMQIKPPRRSYDVISIYQDSGHSVANLIPVACLVLALV